MGRRLYVGNLPYKTNDEDLNALFSQAGAVESVRVMRDMATGRARGFAFVDMVDEAGAQKAVTQFHGQPLEGRPLVVNEARPKPEGPPVLPARRVAGTRAGSGSLAGEPLTIADCRLQITIALGCIPALDQQSAKFRNLQSAIVNLQ